MKVPNFTSCGGREKRLSFPFPELRYSPSRILLHKNLLTFDELNEVENKRDKVWVSANSLFKWRFRSCRHRWVGAITWSQIRSSRSRSLIGQLSFVLVPNIVLAKMNTHELRQSKCIWELHLQTPNELLLVLVTSRHVPKQWHWRPNLFPRVVSHWSLWNERKTAANTGNEILKRPRWFSNRS